MNKIQRVSGHFRRFFTALLFLLPVFYLFFWLNVNEHYNFNTKFGWSFDFLPRLSYVTTPFSFTQRAIAFSTNLIPLGLDLLILYLLTNLFRLYEQAKYFSMQAVNNIRRIGIVMLIGELVNPFCQAFTTAALSWSNPPGQRYFSITLSNDNISTIIIALLIILVSWIMAEGMRLNDEQQLTV